jgi:putative NIF3 family GTP cyclohydrolase 1 type 2
VHPEIGNNAQLARVLDLPRNGHFGEQNVAAHGCFESALTLGELSARIAARLERVPLVIGDERKSIRRIAWCTGAAQGLLEEAIRLGVDAYISGEISEPTVHLAREADVAYIAAGHHATERYGVQALGEHLAAKFGLAHHFVDIPNPV